MAENKSRYVLVCQQALAFATVAAVGLSAAGVVELRIVKPGEPAGATVPVARGAGDATALVSSAPVAPHVRTVPLGGSASGAMRAPGAHAREGGRAIVTSLPESAPGYATVGITWDAGQDFGSDTLRVSVRTLRHGAWSAWQQVPYDPDHEPDPGTDGRQVRDGTDAVVVGRVDDVQVKAVSRTGRTPKGLALAIVDPGKDKVPTREKPAIDTGTLASAATLAGSPADVTPKPKIFSRAQWGADERLRDPGSLHYGEVHAGFVHHTVNANGYSRDAVPSILRGIYAYHTQSRGWSDIGYNFLVDRFGRIWEGRYGGVDRPVVGAHTLGYNDDSFAMSAIGNYDITQPSQAMIDAYARLFAWKLSLHGVRADDTHQFVTSRWFQAINGHRDAGQTACPGRYLYARIPDIRAEAARLQKAWTPRNPVANVAGSSWPDLVVRDPDTKHAMFVRTGGQLSFRPAEAAATGWNGVDLVAAPGDVDEDGTADVVASDGNGGVALYRGAGDGKVVATDRTYRRFSGLDALTGVGDFDGDGHVDLVGREASSKALMLFPGRGDGTFAAGVQIGSGWGGYDRIIGAGDQDGDGHPDLFAREGSTLYLVPGTGTGLRKRVALSGSWSGFDVLGGGGDLTGDGLPDLLARDAASNQTYLYPGDGHGHLTARVGPYPRVSGLRWLAIAGQVTGSRSNDVVGIGTKGVLRVVPSSGKYNLSRPVDTGTALRGIDLMLNVGDWNGDGHGDVMTRDASTGVVSFRAGLGHNRLAAPVTAATGWGRVNTVAAVGDMTGDGYPDLVGRYGGYWRVYPSNGRTGFKQSYVIHSDFEATRMAGVGLWDDDGTPDVVVRHRDGTLWEWSSNGPGGLTSTTKVGGGANRYDWLAGLGDLDGNGLADLVGRDRKTGGLYLIPHEKDGFGPRRLIGSGLAGYDLGS